MSNRFRRLAGVLALLVVSLVVAAPADARPSQKKAIWGPTIFQGQSAFPIYADLNVGIYQTVLDWSVTAPTRPANPRDPADPAYDWSRMEFTVSEARKHGIRVMLQAAKSPPWANGGRNPSWAPKASFYADFLEAAKKRFPSVRLWMIWGEPTRRDNWLPNPDDAPYDGPMTRVQSRGARLYAKLLDTAYGRLKRLDRRNVVIGGNSFTTGNVGPESWIRYMKLPGNKAPRMDLWGHNPFGARLPNLRRGQLAPGLADFSDLDLLARWLDRHQKRPGRRPLRLFLSEYVLPTDHANREFNFYFSRDAQARYMKAALKITRRWSRIYTFGYQGLVDDPPEPGGFHSERGLITQAGEKKPAYDAYKNG